MIEQGAPPVSVEAEQALLGAVLMQSAAYFLAAEHIDEECFCEPLHAKLWSMMAGIIDGGRVLDPITLIVALGPDSESDVAGMKLREYVARIAANATSVISAPDYAKTIRSLWKRRKLMALGQQIAYRAQGGADEGDVDELLDEVDGELTGIRFGQNIAGVKWLKDAANEALRQTAENYEARDRIKIGLETGIRELDELIGPMMAGDLITIVAPSGHGKSAIASQILCAASLASLDTNRGAPSFFVSLEMGAAAIARRVMASTTGVSTRKQRSGSVDISEYEALELAARATAHVKILFDEGGRQTFSQIARKARAMKKLYGIGAMTVDHLRLIKPEHPRMGAIETIEQAAIGFKELAKELGLVIFELTQISTGEQKRLTNWRFTSQAPWGGDAIKQASDVMLGLVLPYKWLGERQPDPQDEKEYDRWTRQREEWRGQAEIGALKNRDDEDGIWIKLPFEGRRFLFGSA